MNQNDKMSFMVGRLTIELQGSGEVYTAVKDEFSALPFSSHPPDLIFSINPHKTGFNILPLKCVFTHMFNTSGLECRISKFEKHTYIECLANEGRQKPKLVSALRRIRDWSYLSYPEVLAKNIVYDVFDWCLQICQMDYGQTWVHASAVEKDGNAYIFLAKGGVGKTTAMLRLCAELGYKYLSDDLLLVDTSGNAYRSPKKMQIYAYNLENEPGLAKLLLQNRSFVDRMAFSYKKRRREPKGVRRRVSAEELFGKGSAAKSAKIKGAYFLGRDEGAGVRFENVTAPEIASRMAPIVMDEIEPYSKIERMARADLKMDLPRSVDVEEKTKALIDESISRSKTCLVRIGKGCGPRDIEKALFDEIEATGL